MDDLQIQNVQQLAGTLITLPLPSVTGMLIAMAVPIIITVFGNIMRTMDVIDALNHKVPEETFEFIVVGGGSSGSAVAAKLSEKFSVLLIEAGTDPNPLTYIPGMSPYLLFNEEIDWDLKTVPLNKAATSMVDQSIHIASGKSLGGSSNTNFMIYNRGNPEDYNSWARHTGDERWAFKNVEKVYKRMEDYDGYFKDDGYHTTGGPLHVEGTRFHPSREYLLKAGKELGYQVKDPNGANQSQSFSPIESTRKRGIRFSTYRAYIQNAELRHNLTIHRYSLATKINFDSDRHAVSVTYMRHGHERIAKASKEIIVSCGSIHTPKLLMLSGIGPAKHLKSLGIPSISNLPVGENLQDHLAILVGPIILNKPVSFIASRDMSLQSILDFGMDGSGPFSSASMETAQMLFSTSGVPPSWPNILVLMTGLGTDSNLGDGLQNTFGVKPGLLQQYYGYNALNDSNFCGVTLGRPKSRGWVKLKDSNPNSKPLINPNYFSDKKGEDIKSIIEGIQKVLSVYEKSPTYKGLGAKLAPNHFPGCEKYKLKSNEYWDCYARSFTGSIWHWSGTCQMGKSEDPKTVVDSQLRVKGVTGLRISDNSIMPTITNTNTNAPAIMIGEMCADIITETWKNKAEDPMKPEHDVMSMTEDDMLSDMNKRMKTLMEQLQKQNVHNSSKLVQSQVAQLKSELATVMEDMKQFKAMFMAMANSQRK